MTEEIVPVEQVDRDAAADFWQGAGHLIGGSLEHQQDYVRSVRGGYCDNHGLVQAFARHRHGSLQSGDRGCSGRAIASEMDHG